MNRFVDKTIVITGAARGIGRALAIAFAREGATVVGIDKAEAVSATTEYPPATSADLDETGRLSQEAGGRFIAHQTDTRDLPALRAIAQQTIAALGHVDVVIANAGIQVFAPLLEMTDAQWHDVIDVNLTGTVNTVRAFAPAMAERGNGRIILTASGQGKKGFRHGSSYAASKWGILGFMKSAAMDLGKHHITVNALVPGLIYTDMTRNEKRMTEAYQDYETPPAQPTTEDDVARVRSAHTALGLPWLSPEDMAPMALFLASDEARHISGASFDVDGGDSALFTA